MSTVPQLILDFSCYNSPTAPFPPELSEKKVLKVIKEENLVPWGTERKWKAWSKDFYDFTEQHREELSKTPITICGFAPQPWFFYIGSILGRTTKIESFINFNAQSNEYQFWKNSEEYNQATSNKDSQIFTYAEGHFSPPSKNGFVHLCFTGKNTKDYKRLDDSTYEKVNFHPEKDVLDPQSFGKIRKEFHEMIRSVNKERPQNTEYLITTSLPNPLNFALGCVWTVNAFGKPKVLDFVNRKYEEVEGLF